MLTCITKNNKVSEVFALYLVSWFFSWGFVFGIFSSISSFSLLQVSSSSSHIDPAPICGSPWICLHLVVSVLNKLFLSLQCWCVFVETGSHFKCFFFVCVLCLFVFWFWGFPSHYVVTLYFNLLDLLFVSLWLPPHSWVPFY